jgi:hypothetical protein
VYFSIRQVKKPKENDLTGGERENILLLPILVSEHKDNILKSAGVKYGTGR